MMKNLTRVFAIGAILVLATSLQADPWKDESGHGRRGPPPWAGKGEPPDWARGKGVWDGHGKHRGGHPPGHWKHRRNEFRPQAFVPAPPPDQYDPRFVDPYRYDGYYESRPLRFYGEGRAMFRWEVWQ